MSNYTKKENQRVIALVRAGIVNFNIQLSPNAWDSYDRKDSFRPSEEGPILKVLGEEPDHIAENCNCFLIILEVFVDSNDTWFLETTQECDHWYKRVKLVEFEDG